MSNSMTMGRILGFLAIFLWAGTPLHGFIRGRSFLMPRSQGEHAERELVGWQETINLATGDLCDHCYASLAINPGYSRSYKPAQIAEYFFGADTLTFSGSNVPFREEQDILADYFALPTDFQSTVSFKPVVQNTFVDINFFAGLDALCKGLYFRVHAPFVYTSWDMRISECVSEFGVNSYPAGYMASRPIARKDMAANVTDWFRGCKKVGDIQPLTAGRIDGRRSDGGLADLQVALGWNPFVTNDYHFGFNLRTAIPTGNKSKSIFLFEPMVGNGRHWELGFGLSGHTKFFESCNSAHRFLIYGDLNATHLFASSQRRSFDFKMNGSGSRYMLIEEIGTPIVSGLVFGDIDVGPVTPAKQQYHGKVLPAINQTTLDVDVHVALQTDIVLKFTYEYKCFAFDLGYNFWGRTSERLGCRQPFPSDSFAIKGDALLYGFSGENETDFVGLNATQSKATVFAGQPEGNANLRNDNADNASVASFLFDGNQIALVAVPGDASTPVSGSNQAILLSDCDIDNLSAAAPAAFTNTIFAHGSYHWYNTEYVEPYLGFGGELSADGSTGKRKTALSEWALWIKVGVSC